MKNNTEQQLAGLFRDAGAAHHRAFLATNGDDPEWPIWYASVLQPKLVELLSAPWTKSEVVYLLVRAERERRAVNPPPDWPEFYAKLFIHEAFASRE